MTTIHPRWRRLQLLHRWSVGMWLGWLPFGIGVMSVEDRLLPPMPLILVAAYGISFLGIGVAMTYVRCPCCGEIFAFRFGGKMRWEAPWAPRCAHCGARIGDPISNPPAESSAPAA